jgi:SAM-dependent MidA family methyltransferase
VLSPGPTLSSNLYLQDVDFSKFKVGDGLEFCPESIVVSQSISERIKKCGGAALIIDYGQNAPFSNSLRVKKFFPKSFLMKFNEN